MAFRRATFCVALTITTVATSAARGAQQIVLVPAQESVGRYGTLEMRIEVGREYDNPFDPCEVEVDLLVTSPSGGALVLPAFYGQDYERRDLQRGGTTVAWCYPRSAGSWEARFAPAELGTYAARARLRDERGEIVSGPVTLECVASSSRGFLTAADDDPRFLQFSEGQTFFAIGQNLAFIGEGQYANVPKAEQMLATLAANGANFVRIWTCCKDWALAIEAEKSAWTRSWTRESPVVPVPGGEGELPARKCVRIEGDNGASVMANPSHSVALKPGTTYVISGTLRTDGPDAVRLQVGRHDWKVPAGDRSWQPFEREFTTGADEYWLGRVAFSLVGAGRAWLDGLSLKESAGGAELFGEANVNRPARGYYNPLDCFMLDQIVQAAERNGIYLMLCVITRDLYMTELSKVGSPEYRQATEDAKKLMRYVVARWGSSTAVGAWEYFNEMDPGKPTDPFYEAVGDYLRQIDIYAHPRTTSTWAPSARDCRHPRIDIAQEHHYMRPDDDDFKNEVESVIRQTRFLREHAPGKPALIGEFGLATPKWGLSDYMKEDTDGIHFRRCLWASALAGSSGTAMFWWWDQLDRQNAYRHYKPLSTFLRDVSFAGLRQTNATPSHERVVVLGYQADNRAYLWLADKEATWWSQVVDRRSPEPVSATLTIDGLDPGRYGVLWWDTRQGSPVSRDNVSTDGAGLTIKAPAFVSDLACKIEIP